MKQLKIITIFIGLLGLAACQTVPTETSIPNENDVCVGEPVVLDEGQEVDLEAMANEAECVE